MLLLLSKPLSEYIYHILFEKTTFLNINCGDPITFYHQALMWKSKTRVTNSNRRVMSSNPRVTSSNARARRLKARVARLKARVEAPNTRVK